MIDRLRAAVPPEAVRYALVGASGVVIDLALLMVLHDRLGVPLLAANVVSFSCAVASNYRLNSYWTFRARARRPHVSGGALFLLAALVGLGINEAGLWAASQIHVHYVWAKLALVAAVFAWNYLFNNAVTFRHQGVANSTRA